MSWKWMTSPEMGGQHSGSFWVMKSTIFSLFADLEDEKHCLSDVQS
jgi:hypothetical protein